MDTAIPKVEVKVGQVWRDWDSRSRDSETPRLVVIEKIEGDHAICFLKGAQESKRRTKIKLSRFRPISTGYKFEADTV